MKTAISLSDTLFQKAEQTANHMGISRSQLFARALEEYISKHNGEMVTQKLNEVYEKINADEFTMDMNIGIESLRELTKNDTW
ncbi:MAG: ChpI protein [Spirochaetes bacterium]|nr:ChpI protein [Spirochaetota bacterium]